MLSCASVTLTPIGPNRGEFTSRLALTRGSPNGVVRENARSPPNILSGVTQSVVGRLIQVVALTLATSRPPVANVVPPPILPL